MAAAETKLKNGRPKRGLFQRANALRAIELEKRIMDATTPSRPQRALGASGLNIIPGIWLIIAPFILGYTRLEVAMWNDIILGIIVAAFALLRTFGTGQASGSWINLAAGIWLIIAPFVLNYGSNPTPRWNDVI